MSADFGHLKQSLVDKILEQGQRLRNAMVQSILQHDPFTSASHIIDSKTHNTPMSSATSLSDKVSGRKLLEAFLSGEYLTKEQEEMALNTIRSLPFSDLYEVTEKNILLKCTCPTCMAYNTNTLKCDLRRTTSCSKNHDIKSSENDVDSSHILKQVDSLKVVLQSIHLNTLGTKKVSQGFDKKHLNSGLNETYFVEYYIPEIFSEEVLKSKSKTDSGLENNHVRVCARRTSNVIHLKQVFIHAVSNLYNCNLDDYDLTFFIRYKSTGQKKSELLGVAKFNLGLFKDPQKVSCGKSLPIFLSEDSPITVGTLKVTLQLGAGKLYFGQEFLDAVLSRKSSLSTDSEAEVIDAPPISKCELPQEYVGSEKKPRKLTKFETSKSNCKPFTSTQPEVTHSAYFQQNKSEETKAHPTIEKSNVAQPLNAVSEEEILFGFLYISEAQFLNVSPNSYLLCYPFCQNDSSASRVVYNSSNPLYNFCQTIPLVYENSLLLKLRENFMLIEFWDKSGQTDQLFGVSRLPLHQFYLGYRNSIILKHLKRNKLPIIGTDWWEPIYSVDNDELIGQVQVLTALGTEEQINNLELERGFKNDIVKAKFVTTTQVKKDIATKHPSSYFGDRAKVNKKPLKPLNNKTLSKVNNPVISLVNSEARFSDPKPKKFDVAVQSDIELQMDTKDNSSKPPQSQDMLASFLKLMEQTQRRPCVENSTNTENGVGLGTSLQLPKVNPPQASQLRKASDLLESLEKALSVDSKPKKIEKSPSFKAQVVINGANQLPSRRKIKSKTKRSKGKHLKQDENILPSTYVTFETMPGEPLQITNVFPKSSSPQWNYKCNVELPVDLLVNGQKRLIFKVWKKCTNTVLQPNMQTDVVLGFAALDLSVLSVGLPNVQGWFNIIDFSGKCNGQINIHVIPLEKVEKTSSKNVEAAEDINSNCSLLNQMSENKDCNELLSRALKRKFTELDEITQRLRLRLSEVVSEDSDGLTDDITDEFEHDINNICIEEDFDLINFEEEAKKFSINYSNQKAEQKVESSTTNMLSDISQPGTSQESGERNRGDSGHQEIDSNKLKSDSPAMLLMEDKNSGSTSESDTSKSLFSDKHLIEGKHRIDTLLEKLSLITAEASQPFSSRYVSGCSTASNDNVQDLFKDLEQHSRPNITASNSFDPVVFQQLYGGSMSNAAVKNGNSLNSDVSSNPSGSNSLVSGGSETSIITNFSDCRPNPDGQGTASDGKGS